MFSGHPMCHRICLIEDLSCTSLRVSDYMSQFNNNAVLEKVENTKVLFLDIIH